MYKKWHECAKLLVLFIKPIVFVHVLIAVTSLDLKVPVNISNTIGTDVSVTSKIQSCILHLTEASTKACTFCCSKK